MTDETPDFIDRVRSISRNWTGEEFTPERAVDQFQLYGADFRAGVLDDYDRELAAADTSDLRKYSQLTSLHSRLSQLHHNLRRAGR
jgi:hypothetical protein